MKTTHTNMLQVLTLVFAFVAGIMVTPGLAQPQDGCVTSKCHADMGTKAYVHGPVGVGACSICHRSVEGEDHGFTLAAEEQELCFACHEESRDLMLREHLHTPVAEGSCVSCHDPHQSDYRFTLKGGQGVDLCFVCHDSEEFAGDHVHGPVAAGDCNACHDPHASSHAYQLMAAPEDLCLQCHAEKRETLGKRHVHEPVGESCTSCHLPHASAANFLLTDNPPTLCFGCHPDLALSVSVATPHVPVAGGNCGECHDAHASDFPMLFPRSPANLCFECHAELAEYVNAQTYRHGPLQEGDCNSCHDPHGSEYHRILRKDFPEEFYTSYEEAKYAMCFECHNHEIVMVAETETLTDFRDGKINLHFLHVNKDVKGRSCRACHQVHASSQEKHIRESVPYGSIDWELPVTFTKTEDGGSCQVGCHAPKGYTRK